MAVGDVAVILKGKEEVRFILAAFGYKSLGPNAPGWRSGRAPRVPKVVATSESRPAR